MGIRIFQATTVVPLVHKLADELKDNTNIFTPDIIVTPNNGINNWLKIELATRNDISANLLFTKHDELISIVYKMLSQDQRKQLFAGRSLQWMIYHILGAKAFKDQYPERASYFNEDDLKRFALAEKLSGLFEKYQLQAPKVLDSNSKWQGYIWQEIQKQIPDDSATHLQLKQFICSSLKKQSTQELLKEKIPFVRAFIGMDFTDYHLSIYKEMAQFVDISFYVFVPNYELSADLSNPLVDSWGGLAVTKLESLTKIGTVERLKQETAEEKNSLLNKIKKGIKNNESKKSWTEDDLSDGSLIVSSSYTIIREVEALYNYLVKTLEESSGKLMARDILVLSQDIDAYASAIQGIFDAAKIKIPYSIADHSIILTDSVHKALEAILVLSDDYKAEEVLQLLEFEPVRAYFGFEDPDFLRAILDKANIRFGAEGSAELETDTVSWNNGLSRLILGYCMPGEGPYEQLHLLDSIEGQSAHDVLRLSALFKSIVNFKKGCNENRSMAAWLVFWEETMNAFLETENAQQVSSIRYELSAAINQQDQQNVPFNVVKRFLLDILSNDKGPSRFSSKGVSFASMNQMRAVPHKVVAILGLNLGTFPRADVPLNYDLTINQQPNLVTKKQEDKYLFFQTVNSALNKLYLSYIGKDAKQNNAIPPASVLDELISYISSDEKERELFVVQHPLHGFNPTYFDGQNPLLYSYLFEKSSGKIKRSSNPTPRALPESIDVNQLAMFFRNPIQYYYNRVLGIYYGEDDAALPESEVFEGGKLQNWQLKSEYVHNNLEIEDFRKVAVRSGLIPLRNVGNVLVKKAISESEEIKRLLQEKINGEEETFQPIHLNVGKHIIAGNIRGMYNDLFIGYSVSKDTRKIKYMLEYYIKYLALLASGYHYSAVFITNSGATVSELADITEQAALETLQKCINMFVEGHQKVPVMTTELNQKTLQSMKDIDPEKLMNEIHSAASSPFTFTSPYLEKEVEYGRFTLEAVEKFKKDFNSIFTPIIKLF